MSGQLFTHYFLTDGIKVTPEWKASVDQSETFGKFGDALLCLYTGFSGFQEPNEAVTEQNLIRPILELLGWIDYLPQQGASRNEDIPDHLLFAGAKSKLRAAAKKRPDDRFRDALAVEESKRFGRALDARDQVGQMKAGTPHGQILRYLSTAEIVSDNRIRWGILTNGGVWRLYDYRARPRASGYFEAELAEMLKPGNEDLLRLFHLLFRRDSFTLKKGATSSFLELALAEGKRYEEQVAQDLSGIVFESAYPKLVEALADATGENLPDVRQSALIFLYRLLFVLYAEDRNLLPVNDLRYDDYGLRKRVRDEIARRMAVGDAYSSVASSYYDRLV
ncbi:MAG: restriction endonuclease, partial [Candidatus Aminicenantes bacterium]|nr:restriction endonuclease [Candidatus Aminicenantes bacterium]